MAQRKDDSFTDILGVDLERPNAARVYDYWLGGSSNFDVDRELGDEMVRIDPGVLDMARANRTFLYQVVTWLAHHGITQFLDLGSGIPTVGNVHEVAQAIEPSARVSYVDNEPVAVAHSKALLRDNSLATVTNADLRNVDAVLHAPTVAGLLDFDRPIAVLMLSVLQYFPAEEHPEEVVARYVAALTPGSYLAISHITADDNRLDVGGLAAATRSANTNAHPRSHAEVSALFGDGVDLVEPGVVYTVRWPESESESDEPTKCGVYGGLGRVRV